MAIRCEDAMFVDLNGRERWLERQAARGLFPRRLFLPLWWMKRGEPRQLRYSLVPRGEGAGSTPREDMLALYQQAGWEFACLAGDFWLFSSEDPSAEPVYSDDESRVAAMRHIEKSFLLSVVGMVLLLGVLLLISHGAERATLMQLLRLPLVAFLLLLTLAPAYILRQWWALRQLRKRVQQGGGYVYNGPAPGKRTMLRNLSAQLLALLLLFTLGLNQQLWETPRTLPDGGTVPRLTQLQQTGGEVSGLVRREMPTLLCPVQLTVEQHCGSTSLYMDYLRLTLPQLAEPMARDLLGVSCPQSHFLWQESSLPGVDLVLLAYEQESGICRGAALCCDSRVAVYDIWSNDDPDLTQALPLLARTVLEGHPVG